MLNINLKKTLKRQSCHNKRLLRGRPENDLTKALRHILEGGTKILGIAALGSDAQSYYNKKYAKKLTKIEIDVIASTPESLPEIIAKLMKS